ncbi:MAG: DUF6368 family protein [Bryobacteraceae bacterium]
MAGPVAGILTPLAGDDVLISPAVLDTLRTVSDRVEYSKFGGIDFHVTDTRTVGGTFRGESRPFVLTSESPDPDVHDLARIREEFGFEPASRLLVIAMCNGREDHQILAELALYFARTHSGVIDLCGALMPPRWLNDPRRLRGCGVEWAEVRAEFESWAPQFPGKIAGLPYETVNGKLWVSHVVDRTFLKAWLQDPGFYMIK